MVHGNVYVASSIVFNYPYRQSASDEPQRTWANKWKNAFNTLDFPGESKFSTAVYLPGELGLTPSKPSYFMLVTQAYSLDDLAFLIRRLDEGGDPAGASGDGSIYFLFNPDKHGYILEGVYVTLPPNEMKYFLGIYEQALLNWLTASQIKALERKIYSWCLSRSADYPNCASLSGLADDQLKYSLLYAMIPGIGALNSPMYDSDNPSNVFVPIVNLHGVFSSDVMTGFLLRVLDDKRKYDYYSGGFVMIPSPVGIRAVSDEDGSLSGVNFDPRLSPLMRVVLPTTDFNEVRSYIVDKLPRNIRGTASSSDTIGLGSDGRLNSLNLDPNGGF